MKKAGVKIILVAVVISMCIAFANYLMKWTSIYDAVYGDDYDIAGYIVFGGFKKVGLASVINPNPVFLQGEGCRKLINYLQIKFPNVKFKPENLSLPALKGASRYIHSDFSAGRPVDIYELRLSGLRSPIYLEVMQYDDVLLSDVLR